MVPTEDKIDDSFRPVFEKWCPPSEFLAGRGGRRSTGRQLSRCGSSAGHDRVQDVQAGRLHAGRRGLHWVGYDEPPPKKHREEGMMRLGDYGGFEMFAMTPLDTNGVPAMCAYHARFTRSASGARRTSRSSGSVHDNPTLDKATVWRGLSGRRRTFTGGPRVRGVRGCRRADLPGLRALGATSTRRRSPLRARTIRILTPVKSNDHRLDALRYACMERFWDPASELNKPRQALGWSPADGTAPPTSLVTGVRGAVITGRSGPLPSPRRATS
jgi:phage terminase large subunit-like protein